MRVLLIDDEADDMEWLEEILGRDGHSLDSAWNLLDGQRRLGLRPATADQPKGDYDLVILDIAMAIAALEELPDWGEQTRAASLDAGLTLLQQLRKDPRMRSLPVLVYTARSETEKEVRRLGAEWVLRDGSPRFRETLQQMLQKLQGSASG